MSIADGKGPARWEFEVQAYSVKVRSRLMDYTSARANAERKAMRGFMVRLRYRSEHGTWAFSRWWTGGGVAPSSGSLFGKNQAESVNAVSGR